MPGNLGEAMAEVERWMREPTDQNIPSITADAVNDAIESLWMSLIQVQVGLFFQGPVRINLAAADERAQIVSISDPTSAASAGQAPGGALGDRTYSLTYALVTESGTETLESPAVSLLAVAGNLATVSSPAMFPGAMGWNVYAGSTPGSRARQNDEPLAFSQGWQEPETGVTNAPELPSPPTVNTTGDDVFYINHLETQTPDGSYRAFNQADIDSEMMRRAAASMPSSSPYQRYMFDLVNQSTLEIRPAAGSALSPRFFYIRKPRRLRFKSSSLPFLAVPYEKFVRFAALSDLKLSVDEYDAAAAYEAKADKERMNILKAVLQMNRGRNRRIAPYLV